MNALVHDGRRATSTQSQARALLLWRKERNDVLCEKVKFNSKKSFFYTSQISQAKGSSQVMWTAPSPFY